MLILQFFHFTFSNHIHLSFLSTVKHINVLIVVITPILEAGKCTELLLQTVGEPIPKLPRSPVLSETGFYSIQ